MSKEHSSLPTILVIFGATGDLACHKILPALFNLYRKNLLPSLFHIVGFSRRALSSDEYQKIIFQCLQKEMNNAARGDGESFLKRISYRKGLFEKRADYGELAAALGTQDSAWKICANKLFYLAVPPASYKAILKNVSISGLTKPCSPEEGWTRVIVEKPFGKDLKSAIDLDETLGQLFKEEQIYRIDHYLGKETVQNILAFRFSNSFLAPAWHKKSIEEIRIRLFEKEGVAGRGGFYDATGALRDVGQNHMLQLLALFTMENPGDYSPDAIRRKRTEILRSLRLMNVSDIEASTVRGQYKGYTKEKGVRGGSRTETYFRIVASLDTSRWSGVPIVLESGKGVGKSEVEVTITFRHTLPCLCPPAAGKHYKNILRYRIQPEESITTSFWVKKPGSRMVLEEMDFKFDYSHAFQAKSFVEAYERLCLDAIEGNQTLFVSTEEIKASWRFIDPIIRAWKRDVPELVVYPFGKEPSRVKLNRKIQTAPKSIGVIGLGKMGHNLALRLSGNGWKVIGLDDNADAIKAAHKIGIKTAAHSKSLAKGLPKPRIIWMMIPAGTILEDALFSAHGLVPHLNKGDIVIDGGNSYFEDSIRRARKLKRLGIYYMDVGVSGGPEGARTGASLMVGGDEAVYKKLEGLFRDLAASSGYGYMGKSGAGHFVKMIHNGIEYAMMQGMAEGFAVMRKAPMKLNLSNIADVYNHGSVIESRLMAWLKQALDAYGEDMFGVSGTVSHSGEGEWTIRTAKKIGVRVPAITDAFRFRIQSIQRPDYTGKILTALRHQFGGHSISDEKRKS